MGTNRITDAEQRILVLESAFVQLSSNIKTKLSGIMAGDDEANALKLLGEFENKIKQLKNPNQRKEYPFVFNAKKDARDLQEALLKLQNKWNYGATDLSIEINQLKIMHESSDSNLNQYSVALTQLDVAKEEEKQSLENLETQIRENRDWK